MSGSLLFVHGLWMTGAESLLLRQRLAERGFRPQAFRYPSVHGDLASIVAALGDACAELPAPVHLVGHSLGGLVILRLLESGRPLPPGRAVLLGSPVAGSAAARAVSRWPIGPAMLGAFALGELTAEPTRAVPGGREVGVIAGSLSAGLGRVVSELAEPNDGTVAVHETQLTGAADHVVLPVSHTGMLFSGAVAAQAAAFLAAGRFDRGN